MTEYSFHTRHRNLANPSIQNSYPQPSTNINNDLQNNVKKTIMEQYDHMIYLKQSNERVRYLTITQDRLSREITETFAILQKAIDQEQIKGLNEKMNYLTTLHKKLTNEYEDILKKELNVLYHNWPAIFDKIKEGMDRDTLEHVLTVFDDYQKGKINANDAVISGMDYMSNKYHLPADFFNKDAVDQFNKNIHKLS